MERTAKNISLKWLVQLLKLDFYRATQQLVERFQIGVKCLVRKDVCVGKFY